MTFPLLGVDRVSDSEPLGRRLVASTSEASVRLFVLVDPSDLGTVAVVVRHHLAHCPSDLAKGGIGGMLVKYSGGEFALKHALVEPIPSEQDF